MFFEEHFKCAMHCVMRSRVVRNERGMHHQMLWKFMLSEEVDSSDDGAIFLVSEKPPIYPSFEGMIRKLFSNARTRHFWHCAGLVADFGRSLVQKRLQLC